MFPLKFYVISSCLFYLGLSLPTKSYSKNNCGYKSCHPVKDGYINVHIVPHTHNDVGWLKTVDQYFYGSKSYIQDAGVQYILDSVIQELGKNKDRRFIYVETAFLWKWWMQQHDFVKHKVQQLIRNGQLEIIGGAWSMNDEATTHYQSIIDQFTWGLRKLNDTFGECGRPKIGWQIDPFGHSREMASIFAQLGYDGLLLGRIDYQDKKQKFSTKTPEFIWRGSDDLGKSSEIFTTVMYNTYSPPPGFCLDILCSDEPIIDDKRSPDYNVDQRYADFITFVNRQRGKYKTNHHIVTMGGDFTYMNGSHWFTSIDALIRYGNERQKNGSKYNLIYSTPSCYLKAVQDAGKNKVEWTVKTDDFFPYASDQHSYWTGYFTSRPALKRYERLGNNFLQVCKQLYSLTDLGPEDWADLNTLREAMGVMQHHDAITGTEKQEVAFDYARRLSKGFKECQFVAATALSKLVTGDYTTQDPAPAIDFQSCLLANISQCDTTEQLQSFIVTVYNPLSRNVSHYVRLPVTGTAYTVTDYKGETVTVQLMPTPDTILNIPGRFSEANVELIFVAKNIPPLGFLSYYVTKVKGDNVVKSKNRKQFSYDGKTQINIDARTGKLYQVKINGRTIPLAQDFFYYRGAVGDNFFPYLRSSGAYIFRPNGSIPVEISKTAKYKLYEGEIVTELHQIFNNWVSQIIRLYNTENFVEFDWLVGPIQTQGDNFGKEIITKYTTNLKTNSEFYTDSNGREILKRVKDYRPTWKLNISESVAGNYYPVTSKILIRDPSEDLEVAVLNDRAQGGSSLNDGEIELMLHRNCFNDDAFGVGESLNETAFGQGLVVRGSHYLLAGPYIKHEGKSIAAQERDIAQRKLLAAWTFVSETQSLPFDAYRKKYKMRYSGLKNSLPDNVQILTLEPWKASTYLLRLEHVLQKDEDPVLSKPVTVNLKDLFTPFNIAWYNETTLGGNQWLQDNKESKLENVKVVLNSENYQLEFEHQQSRKTIAVLDDEINSNDIYEVFRDYYYTTHDQNSLDYLVKLEPMQIRTFIVDIEKKQN